MTHRNQPAESTRKAKLLRRLGNSALGAVSLFAGIALANYISSALSWWVLVISVLIPNFAYVIILAWFVVSKKHRVGMLAGSIVKTANWFVQGVLAGEIYDLAYGLYVVTPRVSSILFFIVGIVAIIFSFVFVVLTIFLAKTMEEDFLSPLSAAVHRRPSSV